MLAIATWNVNSVKARLPHLLAFLREDAPDIVLLQELKCVDEAFPRAEVEETGYNVATHGQKTYNGVAILSKYKLEDVARGLPGDDGDQQARYIEAVASLKGKAVRVASVYVPNGQEVGSEKFQYKLAFYDRLLAHMRQLAAYGEIAIIGGDFNVAPDPIDVHDPKTWEGQILFSLPEREKLRALLHGGWHDAFRALHPDTKQYSWWDYRANAYPRNDGLRIDHLLLSSQALDLLKECSVAETWRAKEKPSDHAPVICALDV